MAILFLDHIQLSMPAGGEARARAFYGGLLGIPEVAKPTALAARGGCWFESAGLKVHLGVEQDFRPAQKAHPAFVVDDLAALATALRQAGHRLQQDDSRADGARFYVDDPVGNRIELMTAEAASGRAC